MNCFYCNTPLDSEMNRCGFCGSEVRESRILGSHMMLGDALQNVPVLHTYHTYDLTVCLRLLREQQTVTYGELIDLNKNGVSTAAEAKRKEYLYWKRRTLIIENILIERQGFCPEKVTKQYLNELYYKCKESINKIMKNKRG